MGEDSGLDKYLGDSELPLPESIRRLVEEAYQKAPLYGSLIGRVSRFYPISIGESSKIVVEIDPETYYTRRDSPIHRVGDYLVIVDIKGRIILGRISKIERSDLLSLLGSQKPVDAMPTVLDPNSLATTALIELEPVMEADQDFVTAPVPASSSIEPQSPVVDPKPEVTRKLLNLPDSGALIGALATPSGLVKNGTIPVYLPFKVFLQHLLIIGTTGSGKTTMLKNIAAHVYSTIDLDKPVMVFIDLNQDFIQILFPPIPQQGSNIDSELVKSNLYYNVSPVKGIIIVLPIVDYIIEDLIRSENPTTLDTFENYWCQIARSAANKHFNETIRPIIETLYPEAQENTRTHVIGSSRSLCRVELRIGDREIIYIPYALNTTRSSSTIVARLMPGLTMLSLQLFKRTREKFRKTYGVYPPLLAITAAVDAYLTKIASKAEDRDIAEQIREFLANRLRSLEISGYQPDYFVTTPLRDVGLSLVEITEEYLKILKSSRPHKGTLEALYRRLSSIVDSGVLDIIYPERRNGRIQPKLADEPEWSSIIELAVDLDYPVVLDLGILNVWSYEGGEASRIIAYRMLERLKDWKHSLWARRSDSPLAKKKIIVVIDEAHQFFPQEKGSSEEQEASRQVAAMISSIARLGRARGIGLVFATHSPKDLHDIIVQLANTKILLRTEKNQLEHIDLPSDIKRYVPRLPDRYMVILSYIYRDYIVAATTTPLTMHYDLSA